MSKYIQLDPSIERKIKQLIQGHGAVQLGTYRASSSNGNRRSVSLGHPCNPSPSPNAVTLGQATSCGPSFVSALYGCSTYADPRLPPSDQNGCPGGWNGCGDTIGISESVAANAAETILVPAAIVFTPRFFFYTGPAATFDITSVKVANGSDAHFGAGMRADVFALASFTAKDVSWPTFYNSPPLLITVLNLTAAAAVFSGTLKGVAAHQ